MKRRILRPFTWVQGDIVDFGNNVILNNFFLPVKLLLFGKAFTHQPIAFSQILQKLLKADC
jgi:hypothetical protein